MATTYTLKKNADGNSVNISSSLGASDDVPMNMLYPSYSQNGKAVTLQSPMKSYCTAVPFGQLLNGDSSNAPFATMAALKTYVQNNFFRKAGSSTGGSVSSVNTVAPDGTGNITLTKSNLALGQVDNTSDANKPLSTADTTALNLKVDKVTGYALSKNDYSDAEKAKVAAAAVSTYSTDASTTFRTKAQLNAAYPAAKHGDYVFVLAASLKYLKIDDSSSGNWDEQPYTLAQ